MPNNILSIGRIMPCRLNSFIIAITYIIRLQRERERESKRERERESKREREGVRERERSIYGS